MAWKDYQYVCRCTETRKCNPCAKRKYRLTHADKIHSYSRTVLRQAKYGLSPEDFDILWKSQSGCCAICAKPLIDSGHDGLHVDHDHQTGEVRGLLCGHCNRGLGQFLDSLQLLEAAVEYMKSKVI